MLHHNSFEYKCLLFFDRFILELAEREDGIVVSNDNFRDLKSEKWSWRRVIEDRYDMNGWIKISTKPPHIRIYKNNNMNEQKNCTADQSLCFHYKDSTIPPLLISRISSL